MRTFCPLRRDVKGDVYFGTSRRVCDRGRASSVLVRRVSDQRWCASESVGRVLDWRWKNMKSISECELKWRFLVRKSGFLEILFKWKIGCKKWLKFGFLKIWKKQLRGRKPYRNRKNVNKNEKCKHTIFLKTGTSKCKFEIVEIRRYEVA